MRPRLVDECSTAQVAMISKITNSSNALEVGIGKPRCMRATYEFSSVACRPKREVIEVIRCQPRLHVAICGGNQ